ncbi:MAG: serine hydrolase [Chloroflexi bacterium]|nr:MAG: serine hydrolase [Chloroflexota bacterium]
MRTRHRLATARWSGSGRMRPVKSLSNGETTASSGRYLWWVRKVALVAAVYLVIALSVPAPAAASTSDLTKQLDGLVGSFPGGAGIWIADPTVATPLFAHDPEEQVIAASLYKLGVLAEAERRVDAGELHYNDTITIEPEDITTDGSFEYAGTELTLDEALEAMITVSDNGAALALWHVLGGANIDATLEKAGVKNFHVAFDDTEDNWATPHAIGTYFTLLAKRQLISPAASDRMLARLERQQINDRLPAQLPADVVIAHKTGNLAGVTHDAGIIFTKTGPRVVVVMTWDALDEDAANFISSIGSLVYSSNLEPAANARYQVSKTPIAVDVGIESRVTVPITNIGTRAWTSVGGGAIGLMWELRNAQGALGDLHGDHRTDRRERRGPRARGRGDRIVQPARAPALSHHRADRDAAHAPPRRGLAPRRELRRACRRDRSPPCDRLAHHRYAQQPHGRTRIEPSRGLQSRSDRDVIRLVPRAERGRHLQAHV